MAMRTFIQRLFLVIQNGSYSLGLMERIPTELEPFGRPLQKKQAEPIGGNGGLCCSHCRPFHNFGLRQTRPIPKLCIPISHLKTKYVKYACSQT